MTVKVKMCHDNSTVCTLLNVMHIRRSERFVKITYVEFGDVRNFFYSPSECYMVVTSYLQFPPATSKGNCKL